MVQNRKSDDDCYIDPMLLIIEWNVIQSFLGCQLVSDHTMNVGRKKQTYYQANQASLGRVFEIKATVKGRFEIRERRDVF
ncbi:24864_t:CDS:2 [Cetraspora pellucida]|uniref:24864_t:CDS:1 n=1 Tax=Cetraspora pellucida TaxID=1433469 RepID=A0A9N9NLA7_9GLOM|nr:24864_t:CDS:2 [Cetraspora pellucida]